MTRAEFMLKIRFLFSDTASSNLVFRESLTTRPGNIIDGNNKIFFLLNRRIAEVTAMYDADNVGVAPAAYALDATIGKLVFVVPPTTRLYVDYAWQKLTDTEIDQALTIAMASGNFDPDSVPDSLADYAIRYAVANCWLAAASRAAEYYTLSAAGKQVSKSELFNHYMRLSDQFLKEAESLRKDQRTDRGDRDIPSDAHSSSDYADPYFPQDGGI